MWVSRGGDRAAGQGHRRVTVAGSQRVCILRRLGAPHEETPTHC